MNLAIPKGRFCNYLQHTLVELGIDLVDTINYSRYIYPDLICKFVKMQDIPLLLHKGIFDMGFACDEWIAENDVDLVKLIEFNTYNVNIAAITSASYYEVETIDDLVNKFAGQPLAIVSEYENISTNYLNRLGLEYSLLKVSGSCESYIPEFAQMIIDCVESGKTIKANNLKIIQEIMCCKLYLVANKEYYNSCYPHIEQLIRRLASNLPSNK
jgi:ATP phosphoribosyltransferase